MNGNEECLAYAEHLQSEHREMHQRLHALQQQLNAVTATRLEGETLARVIAIGHQLRDEVAHHFQQEANGGCLDYAVSRVPRLANEAQRLVNEHPVLLAELDALLDKLRAAAPASIDVAWLKQHFDAFVVNMLAHEARESLLVERGFNMPLD
jgi:hypothetical protein